MNPDDEDFSTLDPSVAPREPEIRPSKPKPEPPRPTTPQQTAPPPMTPPPMVQPPMVQPPMAAPRTPPVASILATSPLPEICRRFKLSEGARQALAGQRDGLSFLDALVRRELFEDAVRFLAHALPRQAAVGWAYLCARQAHASQPAPQDDEALTAAVAWLASPGESARLAAHKASDKAKLATPAGRVCAAIFLSGPDHSLPDALRRPGDGSAAVGVVWAVLGCASWGDPGKKAERFRRILAEGQNVARNARPWESGG